MIKNTTRVELFVRFTKLETHKCSLLNFLWHKKTLLTSISKPFEPFEAADPSVELEKSRE